MCAVRAEEDPSLRARIVRRVALTYRGGADAALDRPAHVRAASGLCWWRNRLAVISDDASFLGFVDPATGLTDPITLPHAPDGRRQFDTTRGNKPDKLDLECVIAVGEQLVALGSDCGLAVRRHAVTLDHEEGVPKIIAVPRLYEALRRTGIGRGHLNLEGATVFDRTVVLGNRGGDVGDDGQPTIDAIAQLPERALLDLLDDPERAPVPDIAWRRIELGLLDGAPLHVTELAVVGERLVFAATAEATTSAYDDGQVTGSVIGVVLGFPDTAHLHSAHWARVVDENGAPLTAKIEGLVGADDTGRLLAAIDADDPARPSELLEVVLDGPRSEAFFLRPEA